MKPIRFQSDAQLIKTLTNLGDKFTSLLIIWIDVVMMLNSNKNAFSPASKASTFLLYPLNEP